MPQSQRPKSRSLKRGTSGAKSKHPTQTWTIAGVLLTLVSLVALIELSPRLSASQEPPFNATDIVPSAAIKNDGYLKLSDVSIACLILQARVAGFGLKGVMGGEGSPPQDTLEPNQTYTVSCSQSSGSVLTAQESSVSTIDVAVVAYYRPWPFTFLRKRKFFKFSGKNDGRKLQWYKEPPEDAEHSFDEFIKTMDIPFPRN